MADSASLLRPHRSRFLLFPRKESLFFPVCFGCGFYLVFVYLRMCRLGEICFSLRAGPTFCIVTNVLFPRKTVQLWNTQSKDTYPWRPKGLSEDFESYGMKLAFLSCSSPPAPVCAASESWYYIFITHLLYLQTHKQLITTAQLMPYFISLNIEL